MNELDNMYKAGRRHVVVIIVVAAVVLSRLHPPASALFLLNLCMHPSISSAKACID